MTITVSPAGNLTANSQVTITIANPSEAQLTLTGPAGQEVKLDLVNGSVTWTVLEWKSVTFSYPGCGDVFRVIESGQTGEGEG